MDQRHEQYDMFPLLRFPPLLKFLQQYTKHINRNFDLQLAVTEGTNKKVTGKLLSIDGENLVFLVQKEEVIVPFNTIQKANVIISIS